MYIKWGKDYGLVSSFFFIFLCSVQIEQVLSQLSAKIESSTTTINSTCNHILTVTFANTEIPVGSSLLMQYSNTWTLTSITGGNAGDFCQTSCNISNIVMTPNSAARTAQIKNLFTRIISPGESRTIRYTIKNIINPSYALTQNVIISLLDSTASLIDLTVASVTASARSISCTVSRTSTTVSTSAEYVFTINPSPLTIPSTTSILMIFPSTWYNSAQPGTYNSLTTTCKSSATVLTSCPQTNGNLNVTKFITTSTSASFSFNVTDIKNPGSDELNNQLLLQFYNSGNLYAVCYAPITGTTARTIPDLSISMPGSLGDVITGMINFTTTELSKTTDIVQIELPLAYDCSLLYTAFVYLNNETVNRQSIINVKTNSTMNYITLQPFFTPSIALYRIQLYNVQLPKTSATISQIKLSIIRNGALLASQSCCSTSYSNISSSSGIAVTLSNSGVGMLSTHYLTITNSSAFLFPNDYTYILIQFDPTKYSLSNPTYACFIKDTLSIIYPITCTRNSSTSILISNLATNNQSFKISSTLFTIGIDSVLTPVTLSSLSLSLALLDSSYNLIQNVTTTYSLVATKINNVSVSTGDSTTYSTTYYSFIINNTNALTISVGIVIVFPEQIRISPSVTQCYINSTALASANCIIDISNSTADKITLTIPNSSPIAASGLLNTNITITSVINPLSLRQTSSFSISLVGNTGQIIEALSQGITVTMTNLLSAFSFFNILTSNNFTMALANYTIQYQLPLDVVTIYGASSSYLSSGIKIVIILPQQYGCMGTNSSTNKPCMVSSTQSQMLSTNLASTPANSTISFIIPSVTNPSTVTVSSSITARLYLGGYLSIQYLYNGLTTFQPSLLTYSISFSNYYIGESNDIEIIINSISNWRTHNNSRYLLIRPPSQFSVDANLKISTNQPSNIISSTISSGTLQSVKISETILSTNDSITLSNILNPSLLSQIPTSQFSIEYRDSTNALIAISDTTTDIRFNLICALPCRTCLAGNSSSCLTCYSNTAAIPEKYYDINRKACLAACLGGQYLSLVSNDFICYTCASSCLTCLNVSDNCTSCSAASSTFLYIGSSKCVSECPPQYYENSVSQTCTLCSTPCLLCTGTTGSTCTLCIPTNVLTVYWNGTTTCSLNCPTGYYNNSNICANCSTNCTACLSTNQCTGCIPNYYLYSGSCLASCPSGLYISIASGNLSCEACASPCLSCVSYSTYCSSCNTSNLSLNKFLFVNVSVNTSTCSSGCPPQYYSNEYYICNSCVSPCDLCTSATDCSSCISGYYLYPATKVCYSVCPINTILQVATQDCRQCTSPCLECVGSIANCLSCIQGYFLDQSLNVCNLTCNLPYFALNRTCSRCAFPCSTCTPLQPYSCTGCKSGYLLFGTSCYSLCPDGSYKINSTACAACTSGCLTCMTSSSTCLSCYPGLYLYQQSCIPSCPTTPIIYFQYQMQCIACQPQCTTCISTPIQCTSCSDPSLYFNQITRQCTNICVSPFYPSSDTFNPSIKICVKCQLPCKICTSTQTKCSTCHNGYYLYSQQCLQNCPLSTFADMELNTCSACAPNCLICSSASSCTSCASGSYTFQGSCYMTCPTEAPFPYLSKYCRNCLLDNCILCEGSNAVCLLCQPRYYLFQEKCLVSCPENYEPDEITSSLCLQTSNSVLLNFLKKMQKFKVYLMPGVILFFFSLLFLIGYIFGLGQCISLTRQENTNTNFLMRPNQIIWINTLQAVIGIPQTLSLIAYLTYLILHPEGYYHSNLFNIFMYVIFILFYVFNIVHFIVVVIAFKKDRIFAQWLKYGLQYEEERQKNYKRYIVIMTIALILNRKVFYMLFSGLWRIPMTCCQISASTIEQISKKLKIITILQIVFVEVPMLAYTLFTLFIQKYSISNYKLFYGTIDLSVLNAICIIVEVILIAKKFVLPAVYKKYILQKVSIESLPGLTQKVFEQLPNEEEEDGQHDLHRSNSAEALKQSQQIKAVQYLSVFDANQYEDPQYFEPSIIENAIQQGRFKKKNLKKKKKKYGVQLDIISEDSQEQQEQLKAKEKNKKNKKVEKKKKIGYLNNFIYWQPPQKERKKKPQKEFKAQQKQIMEKIKQKQSDFDTITRNDIIFREEALEFNSSHDSDPDFQIEETRRALNYQYQAFINKNYAKKRHLG